MAKFDAYFLKSKYKSTSMMRILKSKITYKSHSDDRFYPDTSGWF